MANISCITQFLTILKNKHKFSNIKIGTSFNSKRIIQEENNNCFQEKRIRFINQYIFQSLVFKENIMTVRLSVHFQA